MSRGHLTTRPVLLLKGRECGRSRIYVVSTTDPKDWEFVNTRSVRLNRVRKTEDEARKTLASARVGLIEVFLEGDLDEQEFEFHFTFADERDLAGVDDSLRDFIQTNSLTVESIDSFIRETEKFRSALDYRSAIANYLYGVSAREESDDSGLLHRNGEIDRRDDEVAYPTKFGQAVEVLGRYDRATSGAICGLVAFHYNQFDTAVRRTRSDRVALASMRIASLLSCTPVIEDDIGGADHPGLDSGLSDTKIDRILSWCCIPLDGSAQPEVDEMELVLNTEQPYDQFKLRIIAAEHHLAAGSFEKGRQHMKELQHTRDTGEWVKWYLKRLEEMSE